MKRIIPLVLLMVLSGCQASNLFNREGEVKGTIGVVFGDGMIRPGVRMKVSLVTEPLPILYKDGWRVKGVYPREDAFIKSYFDFSKRVEIEKGTNPDYLVAETISNLSGQFEFKNIKAGKYTVLVAFPSTIGNNRVIWQLPVVVTAGKTAEIELSNDNLAMPSFYDRYTR